jgi:23S rRNA (adenine2503-C2)-methyltransferase
VSKPYKVSLAPPRHPAERLPEEWQALCESWGQPGYRAKQVFAWLHRRGALSAEDMTDLPKRLRQRLLEDGLGRPASITLLQRSDDDTRKLLIDLPDGNTVESVLIPRRQARPDGAEPDDGSDDDGTSVTSAPQLTQCISTQVGCAMGCVFCASGIAGLKRHMTAAEIVAQVILGRASLAADERIRNLVFMGMGEPLHNYDALARALVLLTHPEGLDMSLRRITVSTSGLAPQIRRLGEDFGGQVQLAISLHGVTDAQRSSIMPINKKYPLAEVMKALHSYPLPRRDRITVEYTLIDGINDQRPDADGLAKLVRGLRVKINLIPMNPVQGSALRAPSSEAVDVFQDRLREHGLSVFLRRRMGDDIDAACGQLALKDAKRKVRLPSWARTDA